MKTGTTNPTIYVEFTRAELEKLYREVEKYDAEEGDRDNDFPMLSRLLTLIYTEYLEGH